MSKCDELKELLIKWADKYYFPLLAERNRYRETAQKYMLKCRQQEKQIKVLEYKLNLMKDGGNKDV